MTSPLDAAAEARARAHVIELREREGFPADPATIDAVLAARSPYGWITVAEHEAREVRRATLVAAVETVEEYALDHASVFAGVAYSMAVGDGVHAGFTRDVEAHRRALEALLPDPSVLTVFAARWSFAELERLPRTLRKDEELRALGLVVRAAEVDVRANVLVVDAPDLPAAAPPGASAPGPSAAAPPGAAAPGPSAAARDLPSREEVERVLRERYAGAVVLSS